MSPAGLRELIVGELHESLSLSLLLRCREDPTAQLHMLCMHKVPGPIHVSPSFEEQWGWEQALFERQESCL